MHRSISSTHAKQRSVISNNILAYKGISSRSGGTQLEAAQTADTATDNLAYDWPAPITDKATGDVVSGNITQAADGNNLGSVDTSRTVPTYGANVLGGAGTLEHLLSLARQQSKDNLNPAPMANAVDYVGAGFGLTTTETLVGAASLATVGSDSQLGGFAVESPTGSIPSTGDPTETLAVHCGNGFDAGSSPYQSTRLNRYDAVS
jgi:hypothetical protein